MKTKFIVYYILFLTGIMIFLTTTAYLTNEETEAMKLNEVFNISAVKNTNENSTKYDNSKLIKFNHELHSQGAEIKCADCHTAAVNSTSAKDNLNPTKKNCEECHDVNDEKECGLCHYDNVYKKLRSSDSELYFSHKEHNSQQQCVDCHKDMDKVKFSKESSQVMPTMESCYSCHNNKKAANECEVCHTNLTNLTPKDHLQSNFLNEHTSKVAFSEKNNCMMCHSDNFCQACHSPLKYSGNNTPEDFYVPYYTKETGTRTDRGALQKLTTAHTLNYKFTHGLDADSKSFECKTCHNPTDFCASCHSNGGDLITGISPKSHSQPNFTTVGVNTGGGLHSDLAKRDVESCQSCHDVQGSDPVCIQCHFDNDGIEGTNPRTHQSGYLNDEKGIWHDTQGAVCYTCHTDPNARPDGVAGVGFCGYCHGMER
ncbi:MAG TPA: cytochrome c3 family protein [Ignavibacteria bacterium]|nr:cytochrome c3 family protein [Ignavibacteria bacterium]